MMTILFVLLVCCLLVGCSGDGQIHHCIAPCPVGEDFVALQDCTVPAAFASDDFNWMGGNLTLSVYSEDLYDAVEVTQMTVGDTLVYDCDTLVVETLVWEGNILTVNGGLEQGGAWLQAHEGGTYRAIQFDDHSLYTLQCEAHLPLSQDFVVIDCGANPTDPSDTIRDGQKLYLESLPDYKRHFSYLDTRVLIQNGEITQIQRHWIP